MFFLYIANLALYSIENDASHDCHSGACMDENGQFSLHKLEIILIYGT